MFNKMFFIALTLLISGQVHAATVTILNPSFEDDGVAIDGLPDNWDAYNASNGGFGTYPFNAKTPAIDDFYNQDPPDGTYVAYVFGFIGSGPVGLQQTLASQLMANSQYNLSVAVGNLKSTFSPRSLRYWNEEGFPGYEIQLLAGDEIIASDSNLTPIAEGDFANISLSFTTGNSHAFLGEDLGIRLINQNLDLSSLHDCEPEVLQPPPGVDPNEFDGFCNLWNSEVDFDNVQLSVSAVPVPAAIWLFGTALIGIVGISRRRKVA